MRRLESGLFAIMSWAICGGWVLAPGARATTPYWDEAQALIGDRLSAARAHVRKNPGAGDIPEKRELIAMYENLARLGMKLDEAALVERLRDNAIRTEDAEQVWAELKTKTGAKPAAIKSQGERLRILNAKSDALVALINELSPSGKKRNLAEILSAASAKPEGSRSEVRRPAETKGSMARPSDAASSGQ